MDQQIALQRLPSKVNLSTFRSCRFQKDNDGFEPNEKVINHANNTAFIRTHTTAPPTKKQVDALSIT